MIPPPAFPPQADFHNVLNSMKIGSSGQKQVVG